MKNKEVLFVSNFFGDGGAARVISVLAEELANRGYAVTVCSYPRKDREEYRRAANVKYVRFEMKHRKGVLYKIERIAKLRKEIRKHKDATVISFEYFMNMQTVVAMAGLGNRLIISERNDPRQWAERRQPGSCGISSMGLRTAWFAKPGTHWNISRRIFRESPR